MIFVLSLVGDRINIQPFPFATVENTKNKQSTSAYKCVDITQMLRSGGCQKYQTVQDGWECPLGRVWSVRSSLLVDELIKLRPVPIHSCHQGWKMSHQRKMGGNQSFVDFSSCGSFHDMSTRKSWNNLYSGMWQSIVSLSCCVCLFITFCCIALPNGDVAAKFAEQISSPFLPPKFKIWKTLWI